MRTVAALFIETGGVYFNLPDVEPWDVTRDARTYPGPWPVVAHPPCERWGRYWKGQPGTKHPKTLGDDGGCFASALASVEKWGGIIEHPEASHAWAHHGIARPAKTGGWIPTRRGWTCCVEQGNYGHKARKATWLYYVGVRRPPPLAWGPAQGKVRLERGYHSAAERAAAKAAGLHRPAEYLPRSERHRTPVSFRDLLLELARAS